MISGTVLACAGLVMGAVVPAASDAVPQPAAVAPVAPTPRIPPVPGIPAAPRDRQAAPNPPVVTAPVEAPVTFGLVAAGPAIEGIAAGIATAQEPSAAPAPAGQVPSATPAPAGQVPSATSTPPAQEREALGAPVENAVLTSTFGYRADPLGGPAELHTGRDYACACGTPVNAAGAGTVVDSGWHAYGGGQRVVIDHGDGLRTTYNHLSYLGVPVGAAVRRGDRVGEVGSTGNSTGCHLHFEVMVGDGKVDPQPWL